MSEPQTPNSISQEPVNILFSPSSVAKKDVWDIAAHSYDNFHHIQ